MQSDVLLARLDRIPIWPYPKRLLWIIGIGFFFAFFDIITIGLALPKIQNEFAISLAGATWSITSSLIGYIIGSFLIARISDRRGRRLALYISIGFFSIGSLFTAVSMHFNEIIFWRFITGMGIGAEISEVSTYLGEMAPAKCRGRYTILGIAWGYLGFAVVPFVALALVPNFSWGWRAMFLIGGLGGLVILFMRRNLPDSPRWLISHNKIARAEKMIIAAENRAALTVTLPSIQTIHTAVPPNHSLVHIFKSAYVYQIILFVAIWFVYYIGNYAWLTLAPSLFAEQGFTLSQSLSFVCIASLGFAVGPFIAAALADRIERKWLISAGCVLWIFTLLGVAWFSNDAVILGAGFLAAASIGFMVPLMYAYTAEHFPTQFRATGVALTDGFGHLGGAFCGQIVLGLAILFNNHFAAAFVVMAVTGIMTLLLIFMGKTMTNQSLTALDSV